MVNVTITPLSGSVALDGSIGTKPTPSADTIGYVWASGTKNVGVYYNDGTGTTTSMIDTGGGGTFGGSLSDTYLAIGTAADTIGNFVPAYWDATDTNLFIGLFLSLSTRVAQEITEPTLIKAASTNSMDIPYERWELPNGLRVLIHEEHSHPIVHVHVS